MDSITLSHPCGEGKIIIPIERKKIKSVRLRVYPNGEVTLSSPLGVSEEWLRKYIDDKQKWIFEKTNQFELTKGVEAYTHVKSGTSIKLYGQNYYFVIRKTKQNKVSKFENKIFVDVKSIENQKTINALIDSWLKEELLIIGSKKLEKLYPIIEKHGFKKPKLQIRKLKTIWGNCNPKDNRITINFYLHKANPSDIEYVILHELIHFIHRNHNKAFFELLSLYMPDWKTRRDNLNLEVIQSIRV